MPEIETHSCGWPQRMHTHTNTGTHARARAPLPPSLSLSFSDTHTPTQAQSLTQQSRRQEFRRICCMDALVLAGMGRGMGRGAVVHVGVVRLLPSVLECIPSLPGAGLRACLLVCMRARIALDC